MFLTFETRTVRKAPVNMQPFDNSSAFCERFKIFISVLIIEIYPRGTLTDNVCLE